MAGLEPHPAGLDEPLGWLDWAGAAELIRRGHAITNVPLGGQRRGAARNGWKVATDDRSAPADAGANGSRP